MWSKCQGGRKRYRSYTFARQLSRTFLDLLNFAQLFLDSPSHDAEANAFSGLPIALLILS